MPAFIDRTGQTFSRLTVKERSPSRILSGKLRTYWQCVCVCGNELEVLADSLFSGNTTSCGCANKGGRTIHSMSDTKTYSAWAAAKSRCSNPKNPAFKHYGGRGIRMCQEWADSFEAFFEHVGVAPEGLEIDRIDNNGNYEPGNVRWATRSEQVKNQRRHLHR